MATVISKASIHLSVNSGGVDVGLKKASDGLRDFSGRAKKNMDSIKGATTSYAAESGQRLKGVGEQLGKVAAATGSLASLDLSRPQSVFAALQNSIAGVGSALESGASKAAVFRAALATTGIGLLAMAGGAIFSALSGGSSRPAPDRSTASGLAEALADAAGETGRRRGFDDIYRERDRERFIAGATPGTTLATEVSGESGRLGREAAALGMSADAARLEEYRERLMALATAGPGAAEAFREASREVTRFETSLARAEAARTTGSLEAVAAGFRRSAETIGMSSEEATIYAASMVRVTETVDGVTRTVERSLSPAELLARRTTDLDAAFRGGRLSLEEWRAETARAEAASRRHAAAIGEARSAARALEMGRAREGIEQFTESMQEAAASVGLSDTDNQLRRLEETLRRVGVPADEIAGRLDAARRSVDDLRAAEERLRATEAATALRDADASPLQRARAEIARLQDLSRRGAIDASLRDRSIGRVLSGLTAAGRGVELRGPQMLEAGSVEAERLLREFRRGGVRDDAELTRRILSDMHAEERRSREALERLGRDFADIGAAGGL